MEVLGGFHLVQPLGSGVLGHTYLAVGPDGEHHAVKELHPGWGPAGLTGQLVEKVLDRFRQVCTGRDRSWARHVMPTHGGYDAAADRAWIATPWLAGVSAAEGGPPSHISLAAAVAMRPLPAEAALHLVWQFSGLARSLHARKLSLTGLTPSNLFLTPDGAVVVDVHLAYVLRRLLQPRYNPPGTARPPFAWADARWLPPELRRGDAVAHESSSIHAVGAIAAFACTGVVPLPTTDLVDALTQRKAVRVPAEAALAHWAFAHGNTGDRLRKAAGRSTRRRPWSRPGAGRLRRITVPPLWANHRIAQHSTAWTEYVGDLLRQERARKLLSVGSGVDRSGVDRSGADRSGVDRPALSSALSPSTGRDTSTTRLAAASTRSTPVPSAVPAAQHTPLPSSPSPGYGPSGDTPAPAPGAATASAEVTAATEADVSPAPTGAASSGIAANDPGAPLSGDFHSAATGDDAADDPGHSLPGDIHSDATGDDAVDDPGPPLSGDTHSGATRDDAPDDPRTLLSGDRRTASPSPAGRSTPHRGRTNTGPAERPRWVRDTGGPLLCPPLIADGRIVVTCGSTAHLFDARTGEHHRTLTLRGTAESTPVPWDGRLWWALRDGLLNGHDLSDTADDGDVVLQLDGDPGLRPPVTVDDLLLIGTTHGLFEFQRPLPPHDAAGQRVIPLDEPVVSPLASDGVRVWVPTERRGLVTVQPATRESHSPHQPWDAAGCAATLAADGAYIGGAAGTLHHLGRTGTTRRQWEASPHPITAPPVVHGDLLVVIDRKGTVIAQSLRHWTQRWRTPVEADGRSPVTVVDGVVYVCGADSVRRLDARTGQELKPLTAEGPKPMNVTVTPGELHVGFLDGRLNTWSRPG